MIGDAAKKTKIGMESRGIPPMVNKWFIDDKQLYMHRMAVDDNLKLLDRHLEVAGATRGRISLGNDVKSTARLLYPEAPMAEFDGWATDYVRGTCRIVVCKEHTKVLE